MSGPVYAVDAVLDAEDGALIAHEAFLDDLLLARVVYFGEDHPDVQHHRAQHHLLEWLHARDPSWGLGFEMFKRPFQKWLSDFVHGKIDAAKLQQKTEWAERWGYDFSSYEPLLSFARANQLPAYALNERDEITRLVAREGLDALDPIDRDTLVELDTKNEAHRAEVRRVYETHRHRLDFENFYLAQVIWDETMAHEVAQELAKPNAPRRMLVFAGSGHLRYGFGIPSRAARRGAEPYRVVLPVDAEDVAELIGTGVADYLWVVR